jgi:hypothetical protein
MGKIQFSYKNKKKLRIFDFVGITRKGALTIQFLFFNQGKKMKKDMNIENFSSICISNYMPTYKKGIYYFNKIRKKNGGNKQLINHSIPSNQTEVPSTLVSRNIDANFTRDKKQNHSIMYKSQVKSSYNNPSEYLSFIAPHISKDLISSKNFIEIKNLANFLNSNFTSFFGFESRLRSTNARSDYLIAVSSQNGEREALLNLINNKNMPENLLKLPEWKNVGALTEKWVDPTSELHDKILGLWLEFDTADNAMDIPIPSVFLQTIPLRIDNPSDKRQCKWITQTAIPLLTGHAVKENIEKGFISALEKLPLGASVFHVASMLSRNTDSIRLIIKRMQPNDIVPYLKSLGWSDDEEGLSALIDEIKKYSDCIRLHIDIGDTINPQIGLECFISPDKYHEGQGWDDFLTYLVEKKACNPNIKNALLDFPGVDQENSENEFDFDSYMPSVKLPDTNFSKAIVRYISHVKILYKPREPIEAKAYTGVRLFGRQ